MCAGLDVKMCVGTFDFPVSDVSSSLFDLSVSYCYSPACSFSWEMFSDVKFHSVRMDADNLTPLRWF